MKLRVIKPFYDTTAKNRLRWTGTTFDETNKKRASDLEAGGFVKPLDPPIEQPTGEPKAETKKKSPGRPRKKPRKKPAK